MKSSFGVNIDIVITTYNRAELVVKLTTQLLDVLNRTVKIIVADSSDNINHTLSSIKEIEYIRSYHKNQPYQRYLGLKRSNAEWILFLDDDLNVLDASFLKKFEEIIQNDAKVVGIGSVIDFPNQKNSKKSNFLSLLLLLTGEPYKRSGRLSLFGEFGGYPENEVLIETEALSGGCMLLKKEVAIGIFTETLFSIFEKRWAMGEDKFLSFLAAQKGKLLLYTHPLFSHPVVESSYYLNSKDFQARVLYSRLWLAKTIGKYRKINKSIILILFFYYALWRTTISFLRYVLTMKKERKDKFLGNIIAIQRIYQYGYSPKKITPLLVWKDEIDKNINLVL